MLKKLVTPAVTALSRTLFMLSRSQCIGATKVPLFSFPSHGRAFSAVQTPPRAPPAASKIDLHLTTIVADLERKQKDKIIVKPNEYFLQLDKLMRMLEDPKNGTITSEESVAAIIYLCVMTAHTMPKLSTLEVIRAVQFIYHMSSELGFRLTKEHMTSILAAIPDPFPSIAPDP